MVFWLNVLVTVILRTFSCFLTIWMLLLLLLFLKKGQFDSLVCNFLKIDLHNFMFSACVFCEI